MQYPQPQPPYYSAAEYQRQAAAGRSYTTPAVITLLLYLLFWLPGLIANIIYLFASSGDKRTSGVTPQGHGCLVALAVVFVLLPVAGMVLLIGISALGVIASAATGS